MSSNEPVMTTDWIPYPDGIRADKGFFSMSDIHGHFKKAAKALLYAIQNSAGHDFVFMGDLIDRGPQSLSCMTLPYFAEMSNRFEEVISIMGNHEEVFSVFLRNPNAQSEANVRMMGGGDILSGLRETPKLIEDVNRYMSSLVPFHTNGDLVITHAIPSPRSPLSEQTEDMFRWNASDMADGDWSRLMGKKALLIHGHTRNGVQCQGRSSARVVTDIRTLIDAKMRVCCDVGTPWSMEVALFQFEKERFRVHFY